MSLTSREILRAQSLSSFTHQDKVQTGRLAVLDTALKSLQSPQLADNQHYILNIQVEFKFVPHTTLSQQNPSSSATHKLFLISPQLYLVFFNNRIKKGQSPQLCLTQVLTEDKLQYLIPKCSVYSPEYSELSLTKPV